MSRVLEGGSTPVRPIGPGAATATLIAIVAALAIAGNADLHAPPRFDGAGYAVLGEALATGRGYREIDHPDAPRHAHYPPGYPAALALLWRIGGRSIAAAHVFSMACTLAATLAGWHWFRTLYPPRVADLLGLALAVNWTWGRIGGAIQSEPLYGLLEMAAVLVADRAGRGDTGRSAARRDAALGLVLGACVLTRHVGACLALALVLDLGLRGRPSSIAAATAAAVATLLVLPWAGWLWMVGHDTQVELLARGGLADLVARQALFYVRRIPDQWTGPAVEIGTVFLRNRAVFVLVNAWAVMVSGLVIAGWLRALRTPGRRVAGLVPLTTLPLLLIWPFTEAGRFLIPLVPFLLAGAAEGLATVASPLRLRHACTWAAATVLAASIPYAAYALATDRAGAQRRTYRDFDAASAWIARRRPISGPILTRHPGEFYAQTGLLALSPPLDDPAAIDRAVDRYGVSYLLIDEERYARAPTNPLSRYVSSYPDRIRRVWQGETGKASVAVYAVVRGG